MIKEIDTKQVVIWAESFEQKNLVCFRQAPFRFSLVGVKNVSSPFSVYSNTDYSLKGGIDLIEYIKEIALAGEEKWSYDQLVISSGAKTLFIVYTNFDNVFLDFSTDTLTIEELEDKYQAAEEIFLSHTISDIGLVLLVNDLLNWMNDK